ncbi:MAG: hypothetical protein AAF558_08310 [Verrucomicrobiota bacterium]
MSFSNELIGLAKKTVLVNAVVISVAIVLDLGWGTDQFGEMGMVTLLSVALLLTCSGLAYRVFKVRFTEGRSWHVSATIWAIIALGCVFLAADELLRLHENFDEWIHLHFRIEETALSDRLDDLLIAIYMVGALAIMGFYKNELLLFFRLWPSLAAGFACATLMVVLDALTNREDILPLVFDRQTARITHLILCGTEDILKIIAETIFVLMFYRAWEISLDLAKNNDSSGPASPGLS